MGGERVTTLAFTMVDSLDGFILLSHQRTGSTFLISLLNQHPQLACFGELFIPDRIAFDVIDNTNVRPSFDKDLLAFRNESPKEFLAQKVFTASLCKEKLVGFKLHYEQVGLFPSLIDWVESNPRLQVIHLYRENLLAAFVSLSIAQKTKRYKTLQAGDHSTEKLSVDPGCFQKYCDSVSQDYAEIKRITKNHRCLNLSYEKMISGLSGALQDIQSFLGLDIASLNSPLCRQEIRPLSEVVLNYAELKGYFKQSEYGSFFE